MSDSELTSGYISEIRPIQALAGSKLPPSERLFYELTCSLAERVKRDVPDQHDCFSAAIALRQVLRSLGYKDAAVLGCSVITGNSAAGLTNLCGELSSDSDPAHCFVLVGGGYLLDPTVGQFRTDQVLIPDALVLPPEIVTEMLLANFAWLASKGPELSVFAIKDKTCDFQIAYLPIPRRSPDSLLSSCQSTAELV
jgi:hypothetical protein